MSNNKPIITHQYKFVKVAVWESLSKDNIKFYNTKVDISYIDDNTNKFVATDYMSEHQIDEVIDLLQKAKIDIKEQHKTNQLVDSA